MSGTADLTLCVGALSVLLSTACGPTEQRDLLEQGSTQLDLQPRCTLDLEADACHDCITFVHETRLGTVDGPGYLADSGQSGSIVRDLDGNYWVGQGDHVNVYDSAGTFLRDVGQRGEGPLDFQVARPKYVDGKGRVHIQDALNLRVSVIEADSALAEGVALVRTVRLPLLQVNDLVALDDGRRYVIQAWGQDANTVGLPVHVVSDTGIVSSFGAEYDPLQEGRVFNPTDRLFLAMDDSENTYMVPETEYTIEAWSMGGERFAIIHGSDLGNDPEDLTTPPNRIRDIHSDSDGLLWIMLAYRRPDWRENSVEMADPTGEVAFMPRDMNLSNWLHSRIDVIDPRSCSVLASQWQDEIFLGFVADGMVSDGEYSPAGAPLINIWRMVLNEESGAAR